jgi:hypothetical protein
MKKLSAMFNNVDAQGNLVTVTIFAVIIAVSVLTWGK